MSNRFVATLSLPLLSMAALAQSPTVMVQALTPQTTLVGIGAQTWSVSLPVGPLPSIGQVGGGQIQLGAPRTATAQWTSSVTDTGVVYQARAIRIRWSY